MTQNSNLLEISRYLEKCEDINQYTHFVKGVYIVQAKLGHRFSPKFFKWIDDNEIKDISVNSIVDGLVYSIVVGI